MNDNIRHLATAWALACTLISGCGGSGDAPTPSPAPAPTPTPTPTPPPPSGGGTDTQAPTAILTSPTALATNLTGVLSASVTATDNVGVASVEFQIDGAPLGAEDITLPYQTQIDVSQYAAGQHIVRARSRDAAGNRSPWSSARVTFGGTGKVNPGFTLTDLTLDTDQPLSQATAMAHLPDGRVLIAQQGGALRLLKGNKLTTFHTLPSTDVDSAGERGLIGVAVDPEFSSNRYVYLHYTQKDVSGTSHNRVVRLQAGTGAGADVSTNTVTPLVDLPPLSSATNHNGGALHFGTDGKLYLGVGDNTQRDLAPDLSSPFGKLLRFNADGTIPTDNPHYATQNGVARAIWARGLRNPFTFAVNPDGGAIHINDVGEGTWEEINLGQKGANYGWPASEGPVTATGVTGPLLAYKHPGLPNVVSDNFLLGQSIAGGAFYPKEGPFPTAFRNQYYFADFVSKFVSRMDLTTREVSAFANLSGNPVDMSVGTDGALYVLTRNSVTKITAP